MLQKPKPNRNLKFSEKPNRNPTRPWVEDTENGCENGNHTTELNGVGVGTLLLEDTMITGQENQSANEKMDTFMENMLLNSDDELEVEKKVDSEPEKKIEDITLLTDDEDEESMKNHLKSKRNQKLK